MSVKSDAFIDRFTGSLLGMAIGDALGAAHAYQSPMSSSADYPLEYEVRHDSSGEIEIPAGQFSINAELALCLLETLVTSDGFVDPELATMRFSGAYRQPEVYLGDDRERESIERAVEADSFQSGYVRGGARSGGPPLRAIPVAMSHSLSDLNHALITREVLRSVLITHVDPTIVNGALAVAHAIRLAIRNEIPVKMLIPEVLGMIDEDDVARALRAHSTDSEPEDVADVVSTGLRAVVEREADFEGSIIEALRLGGATHLTAGLAGGLAGAIVGASGIPPRLVDGLEGRAYVLMAAPALLRTAQMRAGLYFQLHVR